MRSGSLVSKNSYLNTDLKSSFFNSNIIADANTAIRPGLNGLLVENTANGIGLSAYCFCFGMDPSSSLAQIAIGYRAGYDPERNIWIRTRITGDDNYWSDWYKVELTK